MKELQAPFKLDELEFRIQQSGFNGEKPWAMVLVYVQNRAIMQRLDDVFGALGWRNEYKEWHGNSQLCGISVKKDGEWITKWDGADSTQIEATKGGLSDSMKRAAVQWGIGRYLYDLEALFADCSTEKQKGWNYAKDSKSGKAFYWKAPNLPAWAYTDSKTPKLSAERAEAMRLELEKVGYARLSHVALVENVTGRKIKELSELTEAEALEVWGYAKRMQSKVA